MSWMVLGDCSRTNYSREIAAVVDQKLYIDGGMVWLSQKGEGVNSIKETSKSNLTPYTTVCP